MSIWMRFLLADWKKTRHLSIRAAHVIIPAVAAVLFLIYYRYSPWDACMKAEAYEQVLAIGFPFLIGIFSAVTAEQELAAGAFQSMLCAGKRAISFFSKYVLLVLLGAGAVLFASVLFGTGFFYVLGQREVRLAYYWMAAFVLIGSNLFLYCFHLFLALRFSGGVTLGLGIAESLLSALLLTGMGEGVWISVPAAWGARFVTLFLRKYGRCGMIGSEWKMALFVCIAVTLAGLLAFYVWARVWDGTRGKD